MTKLKDIWFEQDGEEHRAIRIDFDNDIHFRIVLEDCSPGDVLECLRQASTEVHRAVWEGLI